MERLEKLGLKHEAAIRLRIAGKSNQEISKELGITVRTLTVWWSDDLVKARIDALAIDIEREFRLEMARGGLSAFNALVDMATTKSSASKMSPTNQLDAIREVLNRVPGLERRDHQSDDNGDHGGNHQSLVLANLSDGQLRQVMTGMIEKATPAIDAEAVDV